jgi:nucleotide-binding universal stress UspA family protein
VGQPGQVVAHQASELGADLIILGTHGRTAVAGVLMGSVATRVLHESPVPVLLVK